MKKAQYRWSKDTGWSLESGSALDHEDIQLVVVFASPQCIHGPGLGELHDRFPNARIVGGSSAGNILGPHSTDDDMVATAIHFDHSRIEVRMVEMDASRDIFNDVSEMARSLLQDDLRLIMTLSDGLNINGSRLAEAVSVSDTIPVVGGLMGDNGDFKQTYVILDGKIHSDAVILIGFYGEQLKVGHGCYAGWDEFGINRTITRSENNIVYEIDNSPALELYRKYLGNDANNLPSSGLRFPLSITNKDGVPLIRTLLAIDDANNSLTFAGDVPEGSITLLMKGNTDNLIDGAGTAAQRAKVPTDSEGLAIVISCVGRRMLMGPMADDELEVVGEVLGENVALTGFYSYGELAPFSKDHGDCLLHNQTMTLFSLHE